MEGVEGYEKIKNAKPAQKVQGRRKVTPKSRRASVQVKVKTENGEQSMAVAGPMDNYAVNTYVVNFPIDLDQLAKDLPMINSWYKSLDPAPVQKPARLTSADRAFWNNVTYKVKFGESPWPNFLAPTRDQSYEIFDILTKWLYEEHKIFVGPDGSTMAAGGPFHAVVGKTVDILVRTIMAQGTSNGTALAAQQEMREAYPFMVDGEKVVSAIPNYHLMLQEGEEKLRGVIQHAGFGQKRSKYIIKSLKIVYDRNIALIKAQNNGEIPQRIEMGQPDNVGEFVPGLLSINEFYTMDRDSVFNSLMSMDGIGVKTATCIMAFDFGFNLCAVDTHVMKMATWLGHLPESAQEDEIKAFNHLDGRYPDEIKRGIHQVFWHHPQKCSRCKRKATKYDIIVGEKSCPIEHLMTRNGGMGSRPDRKKATSPVPRKKSDSPKPRPAKRYEQFKKFKTAEDAAAAGYAIFEYPIDDDFASGSTNTSTRKIWRKIKVEEDAVVMEEDAVVMEADEMLDGEYELVEAENAEE